MNTGIVKSIRRKLFVLAVVVSLAALSIVQVAFACNNPGGGC